MPRIRPARSLIMDRLLSANAHRVGYDLLPLLGQALKSLPGPLHQLPKLLPRQKEQIFL